MSRTLKRLAQEKARIQLRLFAFTAVDHWYSLDLLLLSSCYWWYIGYILFKTKILWLSAVLVSTYCELTEIIEVGSTYRTPRYSYYPSHTCDPFASRACSNKILCFCPRNPSCPAERREVATQIAPPKLPGRGPASRRPETSQPRLRGETRQECSLGVTLLLRLQHYRCHHPHCRLCLWHHQPHHRLVHRVETGGLVGFGKSPLLGLLYVRFSRRRSGPFLRGGNRGHGLR